MRLIRLRVEKSLLQDAERLKDFSDPGRRRNFPNRAIPAFGMKEEQPMKLTAIRSLVAILAVFAIMAVCANAQQDFSNVQIKTNKISNKLLHARWSRRHDWPAGRPRWRVHGGHAVRSAARQDY